MITRVASVQQKIAISLLVLFLIFHIAKCSSSLIHNTNNEVKRCINYSPIFFNRDPNQPPYGDVAVASEEHHYKKFLPYLKQHGINCIRLYYVDWKKYHSDFFRVVNELNFKVMITFWQYTSTTPNLGDPIERKKMHEDAVFLFKRISLEPSVFMIFFGNELDLVYPFQIPQVFVAFQEFIDLQKKIIPDPSKRKALSLPLSDSGYNLQYIAEYEWVKADYNTFNLYRGSTFLDFVNSYKASNTGKPLIISETGASSFYQFPHQVPKPFYVYNATDPSIQLGERYQAMNNQRILMEYIASSVVNPGLLDVVCLFEATDEYWKTSNDLNPYCQSREGHLISKQNTCGYHNSNYKDKMIHEAFLGLMRQEYSNGDFSLIPKPSFNVMSFYYRSMEDISLWRCEVSPNGWNLNILNTRVVPYITFDTSYDSLKLFETEFQTKIGDLIYQCKFNGNIEKLQANTLHLRLYNTGELLLPYIDFTGLDDFWTVFMLLFFITIITYIIIYHLFSRLGFTCKMCCSCCKCAGGFFISDNDQDFNWKPSEYLLERIKIQNFLFLAYNFSEYLKNCMDNTFSAPQLFEKVYNNEINIEGLNQFCRYEGKFKSKSIRVIEWLLPDPTSLFPYMENKFLGSLNSIPMTTCNWMRHLICHFNIYQLFLRLLLMTIMLNGMSQSNLLIYVDFYVSLGYKAAQLIYIISSFIPRNGQGFMGMCIRFIRFFGWIQIVETVSMIILISFFNHTNETVLLHEFNGKSYDFIRFLNYDGFDIMYSFNSLYILTCTIVFEFVKEFTKLIHFWNTSLEERGNKILKIFYNISFYQVFFFMHFLGSVLWFSRLMSGVISIDSICIVNVGDEETLCEIVIFPFVFCFGFMCTVAISSYIYTLMVTIISNLITVFEGVRIGNSKPKKMKKPTTKSIQLQETARERLIFDEDMVTQQQPDHDLRVCFPSDCQPTLESLIHLENEIEKSFQDVSPSEREYLQCIYKSGLQRLIPFKKHKKTSLDIVVILCAEQVYSKDDESKSKQKWLNDRYKIDTTNKSDDEFRKLLSKYEQTFYKTAKGLAEFKRGIEDYYSLLEINEEDRISINYYICLQRYHGLDENYFPKIEEGMSEIQQKKIQAEIDFTNDINQLCMEFPFIKRIYEKELSELYITVEHLDSYSNNCQVLDSVKVQRKINCKFYGEGKSMNQLNSAMFLKGKYMLTLDSNMDAYYFEGVKFPCLLQQVMNSNSHIFGLRTHTYTAYTSQVGKNMACAEHVFVATCYKAMCLLGARLHYGNADILDREFFIERGLFSDVDRYLSLSEDVCLGKRCIKFGGIIRYSEGVTFGKGRETNLKGSAGFYSKISGGATMQSSSSIEYELNNSLPLFMLLPLYLGSIGFFTMHLIIDISIILAPILYVLLSIFGISSNTLETLNSSFAQIWVLPFYLVTLLPLVLENLVRGYSYANWVDYLLSFPFFAFVDRNMSYSYLIGTFLEKVLYVATSREIGHLHANVNDLLNGYYFTTFRGCLFQLVSFFIFIQVMGIEKILFIALPIVNWACCIVAPFLFENLKISHLHDWIDVKNNLLKQWNEYYAESFYEGNVKKNKHFLLKWFTYGKLRKLKYVYPILFQMALLYPICYVSVMTIVDDFKDNTKTNAYFWFIMTSPLQFLLGITISVILLKSRHKIFGFLMLVTEAILFLFESLNGGSFITLSKVFLGLHSLVVIMAVFYIVVLLMDLVWKSGRWYLEVEFFIIKIITYPALLFAVGVQVISRGVHNM